MEMTWRTVTFCCKPCLRAAVAAVAARAWCPVAAMAGGVYQAVAATAKLPAVGVAATRLSGGARAAEQPQGVLGRAHLAVQEEEADVQAHAGAQVAALASAARPGTGKRLETKGQLRAAHMVLGVVEGAVIVRSKGRQQQAPQQQQQQPQRQRTRQKWRSGGAEGWRCALAAIIRPVCLRNRRCRRSSHIPPIGCWKMKKRTTMRQGHACAHVAGAGGTYARS
mmetsp:Transcript_13292/g.35598  ORF Transcript_13292/g.35598 Transcript_13292/m.35598 type:complete len:223 (+) Transcript_13292:1298-1966(+)